MNVMVTGRHVEVTDPLKKYASDKIRKFDRFDANITEASFVFSLEKHLHKVEVLLRVNGHNLQADSLTEEMYSSIDDVLDKLDRQIRKMKGKTDSSRRKADGRSSRSLHVEAEPEPEETDDRGGPLIIKSKRFDPKPMTPEEAGMQLDLLEQSFFVFVDSVSNDLNVVYRRKDGHLGLVQPTA